MSLRHFNYWRGAKPGTISGKIYRDKKPKTLLERTKRISKGRKKGREGRGGDRLCVLATCNSFVQKQQVEEGARGSCTAAAQRAATALVVLLISLATKGSRATCRATHTHTRTLTQGVAGSIEPNRAQSASSGIIVKRSICPSGRLLLPGSCLCLSLPLAAAFVATATCATF